MSLVVAEVTANGVCIVSDTHITEQGGLLRPTLRDTIKAIIISLEIVISYAGDVIAGLQGARGFAQGLSDGRTPNECLTELQALSTVERRPVQFLAAVGQTLTRIRNGNVESELRVAWVGDQLAFERFQEERHSPQVDGKEMLRHLSDGARVMSTLTRCLDAVIDDEHIGSVSGFVVRVAQRPAGFSYLSQAFVSPGREFTFLPGEDLISKMAQPVEMGGYTGCVVEPLEPGIPVLGVCFPNARLGYIHQPLVHDEPSLIRYTSMNGFVQAAFEQCNVRLQAPLLRYGSAPTAGRDAGA